MIQKQEGFIHVALRLPPAQKTFLEAEAARNGSSQNSEIIRAINARMEQVGALGSAKDEIPASRPLKADL